jgi:hypothetical protein
MRIFVVHELAEQAMQRIGLAAAATLFLFSASCSNKHKAQAELIGFWESTDKKGGSVEFTKEGIVIFSGNASSLLDWKVMKIFRDFNLRLARNSTTFKVLDGKHVEIQGDFSSLLEKLTAGAKPGSKVDVEEFRPRQSLTFAVAGMELILTGDGKSLSFKRSD